MPRNNTTYAWGYRNAAKQMADGGPVKKPDAAQDKAMMARHNKLMHPGQKSKLATGGAVAPIKIKPENKGKLHRALNVPATKKIPAAKIAKAVKSTNPTLRKQAQFAKNAAGWNKKG